MKLLIESDTKELVLTNKISQAFGIPKENSPAKDIYQASALLLAWNGQDENKQRIKKTAIALRKPIYEILREGNKVRYIRRLPILKK